MTFHFITVGKCFLVCLLLLFGYQTQAQPQPTDSLKVALTTANDTTKVKILNQLCWSYRNSNFGEALMYAEQSVGLAEAIGFAKGLAEIYSMSGVVYRNMGNYEKANEQYFKALEIAEKHKFTVELAYAYNNIGDLFKILKQNVKAKEFIQKSIAIFEQINDKRGIAYGYIRLAEIFMAEQDYTQALFYLNNCLAIRMKLGDKGAIESTNTRIGRVYEKQKNFVQALRYMHKSLAIALENNDNRGKTELYNDLARVHLQLKNYDSTVYYAKTSLALSDSIGAKKAQQEAHALLYQVYEQQKNFDLAFFHLKQEMDLGKEISTEETNKAISAMTTNYELGKKQTEIDLLNEQHKIQKIIIYGGFFVFLLAVAVSVVSYRAYTQKKKSHQLLTAQNTVIEKKNNDITASINSAKRIQRAFLPQLAEIQRVFPQVFVHFQPRDIVSGDFYWYQAKENTKGELVHIFAVGDCTGHGVPGAFTSLIAMEKLSQIVNVLDITEPDHILNRMHQLIQEALHQDDTRNRDGLDLGICVVNTQQKSICFAGARMPLVLFSNGQLHYVKSNRVPVGGSSDTNLRFTAYNFELMPDSTFYLFSDGIQDQFGGSEGKKFMIKNLRTLLEQIHTLPAAEQKNHLITTLNTWMHGHKQIDDIVILGLQAGVLSAVQTQPGIQQTANVA